MTHTHTHTHTKRRITVGRTPTKEVSARLTDRYVIIHNTHNRQTSMPPLGFESAIAGNKRPQIITLDRAAF